LAVNLAVEAIRDGRIKLISDVTFVKNIARILKDAELDLLFLDNIGIKLKDFRIRFTEDGLRVGYYPLIDLLVRTDFIFEFLSREFISLKQVGEYSIHGLVGWMKDEKIVLIPDLRLLKEVGGRIQNFEAKHKFLLSSVGNPINVLIKAGDRAFVITLEDGFISKISGIKALDGLKKTMRQDKEFFIHFGFEIPKLKKFRLPSFPGFYPRHEYLKVIESMYNKSKLSFIWDALIPYLYG
jgi:hypothetical protein